MMGKKTKRKGSQDLQASNGLEVVSKEHFLNRLKGMASTCVECEKERSKPVKSRRRQSKVNSPIVIKLKDSLKQAATKASHKRSAKEPKKTENSPAMLKFSDLLFAHTESTFDLKDAKNWKNFNSFLSAIEKVHHKDHHPEMLLANLDPAFWVNQDKLSLQMLNNVVLGNDKDLKPGSSNNSKPGSFIHNNIDVICNDLSSSSSKTNDDQSTTSEDISEVSSVVSDVSESQTESDSVASCTGEELVPEEIEKLVEFTSGFSLTKYDCPQQECPECLAMFYKSFQNQEKSDATSSNDDQQKENERPKPKQQKPHSKKKAKKVTAPSPRKVLADKVNTSINKKSTAVTVKQQHKTRPVKTSVVSVASIIKDKPLEPVIVETLNSVYVDLTDSDISFTVYKSESPNPPQLMDWYYNQHMYNTSNFWYPHSYPPYNQPYGGHGGYNYFNPGMYYPTHVYTVPRPICVPRDLECLQSSKLCMIPAQDIRKFTSSQPPQRPWIPLANPERRKPTAIFTVMCYNVLCDKYCTSQLYGYTASWALNWEYRKKGIIEEIRHYSADIITLQEVETEMYFNFFLPELKRDGYDGIFSPKSRARTMSETEKKHVDGCAVFYRTTKFGLIKEHLIEFNQVAMANADGAEQMLNRVMTKDNIALAALLETKEGAFENEVPPESQVRQPVLVTTAHVHWDPEFCDVKLIQTMMLMQEIKQLVKDYTTSLRPGATVPDANSIPLILCGDLNSLPDSGVIEYLSEGKVPASHVDFKNMGYLSSLQKMNATDNKEIFSHGFRIAKAYDTDIMPYTNYTFDFKGIIDYIFYSTDHMRPLGVLGPLDPQWFIDNKVIGCPHPHIPSDHFSLLVEYEMSPSNIQLSLSSSSGSTNSTKNGTSNNNGHR